MKNEWTHDEVSEEQSVAARAVRRCKEIWHGEAAAIRGYAGSSRLSVHLVEWFLFLREVVRGTIAIGATGRAAALAFTTLLSLVPLIAALSQVFKAYFSQIFPDLKGQLDTLLGLLLPYQSAQITRHLTTAAENAAAVSTFGTVIFFIISFRLFMTVESVVNRTWKIESARNYRQRLRAFTMLFFWGPVVIGLSLATSSALEASPLLGPVLTTGGVRLVVEVLTFFVAFTMLFWLVPATKVKIRSAAIGAAVTTVLFELVRTGLGVYFRTLSQGTMNVVYGTLGLLIVFLVALEVMWIVILLGVEISFVHQNFQGILRASAQRLTDDPRYDVFFGLLALDEIVTRYRGRQAAPTVAQLANDLGATDEQILTILRRLEDASIVCEVTGSINGWLPAADPDGIRLAEVMRELEDGGHRRVPTYLGDSRREIVVRDLLMSLDEASSSALGDRRLDDIVHEIHGETDPEPAADEQGRERAGHGRERLERRRDE